MDLAKAAAGTGGYPRRGDARATGVPSHPNERVRAPSPILPPSEIAVLLPAAAVPVPDVLEVPARRIIITMVK